MGPLLELTAVQKHFRINAGGVLRRKYKWCRAVDGVSFAVESGQCFGIAGESGSGKTTLVNLILLEEKLTAGSMTFDGKDLSRLSREDLRWYRQSVQTVFQDAGRSLSPRMHIRDIVGEPLAVHASKRLDRKAIGRKVETVLDAVGLGCRVANKYPHELSGGQKQRVAIARAIVLEPSLVILDEPVSSLDVSIRAQILNLLADIQEELGLSYIIVAHDLAVMRQTTHRIAVMYLGQIVEIGSTDEVFENPIHPYTKSLIAAMPVADPDRKHQAAVLQGEIANAVDPPSGCRFHPRCPCCREECSQRPSVLRSVGLDHQVACEWATDREVAVTGEGVRTGGAG